MYSNLPNKESNPQASHIQKLIPTDPVLTSKPDGDTNIPDPENVSIEIENNWINNKQTNKQDK